MQIDVTDEKTFPESIRGIVFKYLSSLSKDVAERILENKIAYSMDVRCAIEDSFGPFKAQTLYQDIKAVLNKYSIISYHATKVLDIAFIKKSGLHTNTWKWYRNYFENALKDLAFDDANIQAAMALVEKEYDRKFSSNRRTAQICFFSKYDCLNNEDGSAGYDQFCENLGGELARWALEDKMPDVYNVLKNSGVPIIVKVVLPYIDLRGPSQESVAYQFIAYFAAKYYWDYNYEIEYDCITDKNVTADKIIDILPFLN